MNTKIIASTWNHKEKEKTNNKPGKSEQHTRQEREEDVIKERANNYMGTEERKSRKHRQNHKKQKKQHQNTETKKQETDKTYNKR